MPYEGPWRNAGPTFRAAMYIQFCAPDELKMYDPKLHNLLKLYGSAFDDEWYYWVAKTGKWIRRTPVRIGQKRVPTEKPRKYEPNRKLTEFKEVEVLE